MMLAIGNEELGDPVEEVHCQCGEIHQIEYGTSRTLVDGEWSEPMPSKTLGFYKCGDSIYLASLNGRAINRGEVNDE